MSVNYVPSPALRVHHLMFVPNMSTSFPYDTRTFLSELVPALSFAHRRTFPFFITKSMEYLVEVGNAREDRFSF